jgi:ABC-type transporter Mla maintaining outer membrane lipid asymmetry ATPase subunit MlaF
VKIHLESELKKTGRVLQMSGMFDVPISDTISVDLDVPVSQMGDRDWQVGLIVGPSGSGKSSLARALWPHHQVGGLVLWRDDAALIDGFPEGMSIREITDLLCSVGLSSPPAWLRPYRVLSGGEQFRADMAHRLARASVVGPGELVMVDEFTSTVDRQVAKVASHAVAKAARQRDLQMVAVTCHYDVIDWLQPDWIIDMRTSEFTWRSVQSRPSIELDIYPADRGLWAAFRRHHYLTPDISNAAQCIAGYVNGEPVAFFAWIHFPHAKVRDIKMGHRLVVLPDWQGLGIGVRLTEWAAQRLHEQGYRYHTTIAHPAMVHYYAKSPRWTLISGKKRLTNSSSNAALRARALDPRFLVTKSFAYVPKGGGS